MCPLARVTANLLLQIGQIDELIGLPAEFVCGHGRVGGEGRNDGDPLALVLQRFHQGAEIAVAGEYHQVIEMVGELHGVHGKLNVHVSFDFSPPRSIDKFFRRLCQHGVAVAVEPIDQRSDGGVLLVVDQGGLAIRPDERPLAAEQVEKPLVISVKSKCLGGRV